MLSNYVIRSLDYVDYILQNLQSLTELIDACIVSRQWLFLKSLINSLSSYYN